MFAILIASIKIAAKNEDIYRQAAIRIAGSGTHFKETEKKLKAIASKTEWRTLGPIKRGEIIRMLAFRGLDIELFGAALNATETRSVITNCEVDKVSLFVADFFQSFKPADDTEARSIILPKADTPLANYWLTLIQQAGIKAERFSHSTGIVPELLAS